MPSSARFRRAGARPNASVRGDDRTQAKPAAWAAPHQTACETQTVPRRAHVDWHVWERMFAHMPPPYPIIRARLDRALAEHDLAAFRRAAREFPGAVTLGDALQVLALMLKGDDPAFEFAAVRWIHRFTGECRGVALTEVRAAVEALDGLPDADANATLTALLKRHSRSAGRSRPAPAPGARTEYRGAAEQPS
jgi:hypothetical protein